VYNGLSLEVDQTKMKFYLSTATWLNPKTGDQKLFAVGRNEMPAIFDPPGEKADGNDWILILEK